MGKLAPALTSFLLMLVLAACGGDVSDSSPSSTTTATGTPFVKYELKFFQPKHDVDGTTDFEGGNQIIRIYYNPGMDSVEYNIIFKDEDAPIGDKVYDNFRNSTLGRTADIEPIIVHLDSESENIESIEFPTTFSGEQEFFVSIPQHYSETEKTSAGNIYINTWNHLFAWYDTNTSLGKYTWNLDNAAYQCDNGMTAEFIRGSRTDAETWAKGR